MPSYRYDRLSAQDNTFLVMETPNTHMHVAGFINCNTSRIIA